MKKLFRNLTKDEVEVRRSRTFNNGKVELLIYKNARVDMNLLDETFGHYGWATQYKTENGILFCGVALYDKDNKTWIWKWNSGAEGNFEKEKAVASDAFKRACFLWGLGRELYSAPKIIVNCENEYEQFYVDSIGYDENDRICDLQIVNAKGEIVFNYKDGRVQKIQDIDPIELLSSVCKELKEDGENYEELGRFFKYYKTRISNFDSVSGKTIRTLWNKWNSKK